MQKHNFFGIGALALIGALANMAVWFTTPPTVQIALVQNGTEKQVDLRTLNKSDSIWIITSRGDKISQGTIGQYITQATSKRPKFSIGKLEALPSGGFRAYNVNHALGRHPKIANVRNNK